VILLCNTSPECQCSVLPCVLWCRYVIWYKRGYQEFDKLLSAATTKVKGVAVTNCSQLNISVPGAVNGTRIWDVADYVVPPQVIVSLSSIIVSPSEVVF